MSTDKEIQKGLSDRLYDKRKYAAVELEQVIRDCLEDGERDKIKAIIDQLCRDFAYAIHHPNARNGGLIGLAAAAIALGQNEVVEYLEDIVHPVLACFGDQDARVRYYACESMYNISKVAKGEILVYFNELFDALSKLSADSDPSVQNGADLLNRLIKDIVAEKAATYVSIISDGPPESYAAQIEDNDPTKPVIAQEPPQQVTTFSLPRFIPLLMERIYVINPATRTFLVSWITLLDSIPDLELVSFIPSFLGGLINYLNDPTNGVRVATHACLDIFLEEIRRITEIKRIIEQQRTASSQASVQDSEGEDTTESRNTSGTTRIRHPSVFQKQSSSSNKRRRSSGGSAQIKSATGDSIPTTITLKNSSSQQLRSRGGSVNGTPEIVVQPSERLPETSQDLAGANDQAVESASSSSSSEESDKEQDEKNSDEENDDEDDDELDGIYIPGQDVYIDFERIIEILISHLDSSVEEIQLVVLNWIEAFLDISPSCIFPYGPRFLSVLLPTMAYEGDELRKAAERVNRKMLDLIMSLPEDSEDEDEEKQSEDKPKFVVSSSNDPDGFGDSANVDDSDESGSVKGKLDYSATVNALTLHFLDEKEETRVAALDWLIMLHRKVPKKILAINDGTFPALLKTLSDPSEQVITRDLQLLAQISYKSDDEYFTVFMVNLLNLFSTDRRLLETRGNLIIRQLCVSLRPERIYWTLAEILEREDEDLEFASIMVQNLSNILITAPELSQLRMRLRSLNNKEGVLFFTALFRSWCHNPSAALALCLLSQAYEHAFLLLQTIVDFEITVPLLIQIDKLVQLLESPVFTHLRLQLLEPEKFPYLYKCLYGILMLLPQSSAFATLRNRLNSVSSIGFLHVPPPHILQQTRGGSVGSTANSGSGVSGTAPGTGNVGPTDRASVSSQGGLGGGGNSSSSSNLVSRYSASINMNSHNNTPLSFYDVRWTDLMKKFHAVQQRHQDVRNSALSRSFGDMKLYGGEPIPVSGSGPAGAGDMSGGVIGNISGLSPRNNRKDSAQSGSTANNASGMTGSNSFGVGGGPAVSTPSKRNSGRFPNMRVPGVTAGVGIRPVAATTTTASQNHAVPASPVSSKLTPFGTAAASSSRDPTGGHDSTPGRQGVRRMLGGSVSTGAGATASGSGGPSSQRQRTASGGFRVPKLGLGGASGNGADSGGGGRVAGRGGAGHQRVPSSAGAVPDTGAVAQSSVAEEINKRGGPGAAFKYKDKDDRRGSSSSAQPQRGQQGQSSTPTPKWRS